MSEEIYSEEGIVNKLLKISNDGSNKHLHHLKSLIGIHQYKPLYKITKKYLRSGSQVLDWGAFNGHFSYFLFHRGFKVTGFSLDDFNFKSFLDDPMYKFVKGSIKTPILLPFKDNSFDGVVSVGVLEHVRETGGDELKSLKEIKRILKPQGFFICYHFPNKYSVNELVSKLLTKNFTHQFKYSNNHIKKLTVESGLKLIEIKRYGILPRNSISKLPYYIRSSKLLALIFDQIDDLLSKLLSPFCQNYYFVVKKN